MSRTKSLIVRALDAASGRRINRAIESVLASPPVSWDGHVDEALGVANSNGAEDLEIVEVRIVDLDHIADGAAVVLAELSLRGCDLSTVVVSHEALVVRGSAMRRAYPGLRVV